MATRRECRGFTPDRKILAVVIPITPHLTPRCRPRPCEREEIFERQRQIVPVAVPVEFAGGRHRPRPPQPDKARAASGSEPLEPEEKVDVLAGHQLLAVTAHRREVLAAAE